MTNLLAEALQKIADYNIHKGDAYFMTMYGNIEAIRDIARSALAAYQPAEEGRDPDGPEASADYWHDKYILMKMEADRLRSQSVREEVIEECAKVAEKWSTPYAGDWLAEKIATEIRALKSSPPGEKK